MNASTLLRAGALSAALLLGACATFAGGDASVPIPADAQRSMHTEPNGDVIEEYRVAGRLHTVKVTPARGPTYYLTDADGDGQIDNNKQDGISPVYFKLFSF
ncbi:DUF2782 domain-containing protein [Luteimonas sp. SX5]|uniref:DUF2782 domain-containing protein n=1 Tax=Luteimonas galliterrae TaxID=2940486 RepID=A0ABT0MJG8_9GAMM|nr:DUF2782 domain-containing protein [Luteimonas galliterrae]MCL1635010.1 DUF2782 domain-containing protein [Luteimonas galliterrae]